MIYKIWVAIDSLIYTSGVNIVSGLLEGGSESHLTVG